MTGNGDIFIVTDSEEITLICETNKVNCFYKQSLRLQKADIIVDLKFFILKIYKRYRDIIIFWPYTPLLNKNEILRAYNEFNEGSFDVMVTLREEDHRVYEGKGRNLQSLIFEDHRKKIFTEMKSFVILKASLIPGRSLKNLRIQPFVLSGDEVEIRSYQDWWLCEKLLHRKRIILRVIGDEKVGMGHIYRSLTLAREIDDHEIIFICDEKSHLVVNNIAGYDYLVETASGQGIEEKIIALKPDLVILDMLNTTKKQVLGLKKHNIKVISFEDLGSGSRFTDLTINELYDRPQTAGQNIEWGHENFFIRDEFDYVKPNKFKDKVNNLLITYGGTDHNNLSLSTLQAVEGFCREDGITIHVVTGIGYSHKQEMLDYIKKSGSKIEFTNASGVISRIMSDTQLAIVSNGRTVYELVHMNVPSIVVSHHEREKTHSFSAEENGLINIGLYQKGASERLILKNLKNLVRETAYRKKLFDNTTRFNFAKNKSKVVKKIKRLLEA